MPSVASPAVPWDDDDDDARRPPPAPEDRPWRHPSELGAPEGVAPRVVVVPRAGASRLWLVGVLSCLLGSGATVGLLAVLGAFDDETGTGTAVERVVTEPAAAGAPTIDIAAPALPAVVRIEARGPQGVVNGTGVMVRSDGFLLATSDCVDGAEQLAVWLSDGRNLPADLVGRDRASDIAVLKVDATDLAVATMVDGAVQEAIDFGDPTVVIDAAPSSGPTPALADGFVSDTSRRVDGDNGTLFGMLQVSSSPRASAPGTGQVLLDGNGSVIGIVSSRGQGSTDDDSADDSGLDLQFATPIDHARNVFDQITTDGQVRTPLLGVTGVDVAGSEAERYGASAGLKIETVEGDTPAAEAGLAPDDVLVAVDGDPIADLNDLVVALRDHVPGEAVSIVYVRKGTRDVANAVLTEKPSLP